MGTPEFAVPALRAVAAVCDVLLVVTQPDRPRGRGRASGASAVAEAATTLALPVLKPEDMRSPAARAALAALTPDLFAVVAFGAILSPELLDVPRVGSLNLHGSLLPDYRGASPVQRALWDGRAWTGVTTLWMDEGIDTGDVVLQRWASIDAMDDAGLLTAKLASLGGPLLAESLLLASAGRAPRRPQDRAAGSYAKKLTKQDGVLEWGRDAATLWNHQRAVTPWPGATTGFGGRRLQILACRPHDLLPGDAAPGTVIGVESEGVRVACGRGTLLVTRVKPEARSGMDAAEWARGARIGPGSRMETIVEKEAHA
jgi:methionyl-tRNA formyltransferase